MEAMEVMEDSEFKILREALDEHEVKSISITISRKLETYFNGKIDEFVTAKAVFQANRKSVGKF